MSESLVFWQPDTGKLPVLVGELVPESGGEVAGSRRVRRWGRVEQVEEARLRGPGAPETPQWVEDLGAVFGLVPQW